MEYSGNNKIAIVDDKAEILINDTNTILMTDSQGLENKIFKNSISLIIIQREMNDEDGADIVKRLREDGIRVPIILVSSKDSQEDILYGFKMGCDEYITKPIQQAILNAKVSAITSRGELGVKDVKVNDFCYHGKSNSFTIGDKAIELTKIEKKLLLAFMRNHKKVLTRDDIISRVWNNKDVKEATVNVVIKRLKEKIDPNNERAIIRSVYRKGYIFVVSLVYN